MLYDPAMEAGMTPQEFWDASLAEVEIRIENYARKRQMEQKETVGELFLLAKLFAERHPPIPFVKYPSDQKWTMPWDIFPELYTEEKRLAEEAQEREEFERFKESRQRYFALHNQRLRGGEISG